MKAASKWASSGLVMGLLLLSACPSAGPGELGQPQVERHSNGTLIVFGAPYCTGRPAAMTLKFFDHGPGTYVAEQSQQNCSEPDGGTMLCDFGLEATLGSVPGTGTLKILEKPQGAWGDFEGEVDLKFPADGGQRAYVFSFVAPVCGIE